MSTTKTIEKIFSAATKHSDEPRFVRTIAINQWARQGDVNIERVSDDHPRGDQIADRQLAPGTTKGSRHCVEGNVTVYAPASTDPLQGPIVESGERFTVTHPEHANLSLPSGTYSITYQRDYAMEERARVAD